MNWSDILQFSGVEIGRGERMVEDLRYLSYAMNRKQGMSAERLSHIFPRADKFEIRYLSERQSQPTEIAEGHASDCAVHNMPAFPNGDCDCGVSK